jgi:AcrR family transcriptional regulator
MNAAQGAAEEHPSRREREKAAHRREIMDAAVRVFARKGFAFSTLEDIAKEAEFSKGAIYLYFESKEDLLRAILVDLMENTIIHGIRTILSGKRSFREELIILFNEASDFAFTHILHMSVSMPMHLSNFSGLTTETKAKINSLHEEFITLIRSRVEKARQDGEIRDVSIEAVAGLIHGTLDSMVMTRWCFETAKELKHAAAAMIEIIFDGIERKKEQAP